MNPHATDTTPRPGPDALTRLAFERTRVAYERTLMAWVRTAASLITFGFSVYKFFQIEMKPAMAMSGGIGARGFGLTLIAIGLLALLLGTGEHWRDLRTLRPQYPDMPRSMSAWVSLLIGALGLVALVATVQRL
jgi:putative membrane protein